MCGKTQATASGKPSANIHGYLIGSPPGPHIASNVWGKIGLLGYWVIGLLGYWVIWVNQGLHILVIWVIRFFGYWVLLLFGLLGLEGLWGLCGVSLGGLRGVLEGLWGILGWGAGGAQPGVQKLL